jgi:hypothetical protein
MASTAHHRLPEGLPPLLDLRTPPADAWRARRYQELISLLEQLGHRLDNGSVSRAELREWERQVVPHLREAEIDCVMAGSDDDEFDVEALPEHRWRNLKKVLMHRKGLSYGLSRDAI